MSSDRLDHPSLQERLTRSAQLDESRNLHADSVDRIASSSAADFLAGGGEIGALMRMRDWTDTPLGPPKGWPQSLKTVVRILLTSRYQMWMGWGRELLFFYNDAYRPTLGVKHAWALGSPAREVWKEIWSDIGPRIDHVLASGEATWDEGLLLFLERSGYPEETYHTFSYSPLADDAGSIVGMLCVVMEETERIIGERRLSILRDLASDIAGKNARNEVLGAVQRQLGANLKDLPFTLTYLFDQEGLANLACATGVPSGDPIAAAVFDPKDPNAQWPAGEVMARRTSLIVDVEEERVGQMPSGAWDKPPRQVLIAPIARQGQVTPAGFLVAGANPYRPLDEAYRGFIDLVAGQIASGIANANAYEEERRRAEALAEIDRAKTTFFSNVSHELRTPLTLILGPLEEVLTDRNAQAPSDHRSLVNVAHRNAVRLLKLVNTLLDFSRIEAGRVQANFEPVNLADLTAEIASSFRSAIEKAGLRFVVDCRSLPQQVYVDRDLWEKVILNLVSNALKFTFVGGIAVETRPSCDGQDAEVVIRDTGIGIPAAELPHLFERFHRVEGARGRTIEGSGIGLALVLELIKIHGGTIHVASEIGEGSAFTVTIPFGSSHLPAERMGRSLEAPSTNVRAQAYIEEVLGWDYGAGRDPVPPIASEPSGAVAAPSASEDRLVLLADDNADMRNYVQRLLLTAGFRVEAVTNGADALVAVRRLKPDLVLSDIMMPELDGFGLLKALREDSELRYTPVLLLSARAGEEAKIEGLSAGADDYLTKPFSARELVARVRTNLDMAKLRREALRVEAELRLQAQLAQDRAEGILASINDGFLALDSDWRFTYVNAAAERMISRHPEELIGRCYWKEYPSSIGTTVESNFRRAMVDRMSVAFEYLNASKHQWFDVRAYPARDGGLSIYFQDITGRKQAEDALQNLNQTLERLVSERTAELHSKEARLRTIFETSFSYQGLLALDGTLLDANATSLSGIATKRDDVVGRPFWETPWFTGTPGLSETVQRAIPIVAAGGIVREEIHVNLPVGGWRWFDFQMRPVRDSDSNVVAIVPEAVEFTKRRQAEEALRQAQKMDSIGQLTGGVAHDFNNLLTIIIGNLETLRRRLKAPSPDVNTLEHSVDGAMRGAERAASLTQRLLAFSRQQPLDPKPVDVGRLVTGMSDLLRRTIGEQIAVETVLAGGLWHANIDANQLEIVIINLAVNARDAMPNGGTLTIETSNAILDEAYVADQSEVTAGQYVLVSVTDNGIGMTREVLSKAFEPFFTTKDVGHGTGLGLSQVYGFIKQSDGHIKIYSEAGLGTTVRLYLPRVNADEAKAEEEPKVQLARGREGETILIVEDDDDVRAYTRASLRELGYTILEAADGAAALEVLERHPEIQLLFTDVGLPGGMNGRQLAAEARQRRRRLKVLFTTGYARDALMHSGRLDTGVQLIFKPFTYAALATKIRDMLNSPAGPSRILVVEDEVLIQMLAADYLEELGLQAEIAGSAAEAKKKLLGSDAHFEAAIVDMGLPDAKGDVVIEQLRAVNPHLAIVVASGQDEASLRERFKSDNSIGVLSKPYTMEQLRSALRSIGLLD